MGNILVDLDATFGKFQFSFLSSYQHGSYETAAQFLYQANSSLPPDAMINDMPRFQAHNHIEGKHSKSLSLKSELVLDNHAKEYCDNWAPIVWQAIAQYTVDMLERLDED